MFQRTNKQIQALVHARARRTLMELQHYLKHYCDKAKKLDIVLSTDEIARAGIHPTERAVVFHFFVFFSSLSRWNSTSFSIGTFPSLSGPSDVYFVVTRSFSIRIEIQLAKRRKKAPAGLLLLPNTNVFRVICFPLEVGLMENWKSFLAATRLDPDSNG